MRQLRPWAATLCALVLLAACADAPTAPTAPQGMGERAVAGTLPSYESQTVQGCVTDGLCLLPPISGGGSTCDPYLELDWRCDDGGGDCMTAHPGAETDSAHVGLAGCPDPFGPGRGGGYHPEPVPGDTCQTGDAVFDDPVVQEGFRNLWAQSNPDQPEAQRLEQAAWIVQQADGSFQLAPFTITTQGPCSINGSFLGPPGAVAWVHTHPYTAGERRMQCGGALKVQDPATGAWRDLVVNGQVQYPVYENRPSTLDLELLNDVNRARQQIQNLPKVAGVILDANQTTVYSDNPAEGIDTFPRCGY